jgi:hypothetical protein
MIFRGSLRHSVTEAHSPTTVHAAVNEVKPSGPCSPATPRGMLQIVQDNRRLRAPTWSPKHRTALHRNSHLLNTHHYQLTTASCIAAHQCSALVLTKKRRRRGRLARHLHHHRPGPRPTHPTQRLIVAHLDIPIPWPETRPAATTSDQPSHDLRLGDHPLSVLPGGYRVVVPSGRLRPP